MLNTREKLIEILRQTRYEYRRYIAIKDYEKRMARTDEEFLAVDDSIVGEIPFCADHLIANGVTVQKWIPVTERLPDNDYRKHWKERHYYLVRLQHGQMRTARYGYKKYDWWVDSHNCVLSKEHHTEVTHWMPLPEPPKGE